jgi:hypothetical protein
LTTALDFRLGTRGKNNVSLTARHPSLPRETRRDLRDLLNLREHENHFLT